MAEETRQRASHPWIEFHSRGLVHRGEVAEFGGGDTQTSPASSVCSLFQRENDQGLVDFTLRRGNSVLKVSSMEPMNVRWFFPSTGPRATALVVRKVHRDTALMW